MANANSLNNENNGDFTLSVGDILCSGDRTQDLGSATNAFGDLYVNGISFDDGSNSLNAFESASYNPTISGGGGSAGAQAYTDQTGYYIRIGNLYIAWFSITMSNKGSWTGAVQVGLPATPAASTPGRQYICGRNLTFSGSGILLVGVYSGLSNTFGLQSENGSGGATNQDYGDLTNTTFIGGVYMFYV